MYYIIYILLPLIIGTLIGRLNNYNKEEYNKLKKPNFQPPSYVFGIVWPILYLLIGISYYYVLKDKNYIYYVIPLIGLGFNFSYTPIFFGSKKYDSKKIYLSFIIVILTLIFGILTLIEFYYIEKNKYYSYLLIPYILWLSFASILSYKIYDLNKINN